MKKVTCPKCKKLAGTSNTKYGTRNSCCDLWSWGEGNPIVDCFTHDARKFAHAEFDKLWKSKMMTRRKAYAWLAKKLNMPKRKCHIKQFNESQCFDVEQLSKRKFKKLFIEKNLIKPE